jgi:hypothetical protein
MSGATPLGSQSTALFRRFGINSEKKHLSFICVCLSVRPHVSGWLLSVCPHVSGWLLSVCLSARIRVAPTARILVKSVIENLYKNMWLNSVFGNNRTAISDTWHEYLSAVVLLTAVRNILWLDNSAMRTCFWVSMANFDGSILFTATCRSTVQGYIVAFPQQQWLRESVTVFSYTNISHLFVTN